MPETEITLREYVEEKIVALEQRLRVQMEADAMALRLQAKEIERRLDDLNHAHRDSRIKEQTFLPRETWEQFLKSNNEWREQVMVQMAAGSGRNAAYGSIVAIAVALAGLLLNFVKH